MINTITNKLELERIYSWFGTSPSIPFTESVFNNEELFNIDFQDNYIGDQIDLVNYLEETLEGQDYTENQFISYHFSKELPTEVLLISANINHTIECNSFNNLFNLLVNSLFTEKLDDSLQAFILSGKPLRFQLIFNYSNWNIMDNTWIDSTSFEYISNQSPINNVLKEQIDIGRDTIWDGKFISSKFPIVSPIFEYIPSSSLITKLDTPYLIRVLQYDNLTATDKNLLTPYSQIIPKFGSSENIPLQYLYEDYPTSNSKLNWSQKVDKYLENAANIDTVSVVIWS